MRVITLLMNRKREDARVFGENRRRAVALMHVGIHHHRSLDRAFKLQPSNGDRNVVDHAESLAVIGARMMESTSDIRRPAVRQRAPPG